MKSQAFLSEILRCATRRSSSHVSVSLTRGIIGALRKRPRHASEALGEVHYGWASGTAGRNASESRAGLESGDASADPTEGRGRPQRRAGEPRRNALRLAGVLGAARGEGLLGNVGDPSWEAGRDCRRRTSRCPWRESERLMVPTKPVTTVEGRGLTSGCLRGRSGSGD